MNDYALLIASVIVCCPLIALLLMYLYYCRMVQYYNKSLTKYIHEYDRLTRELERTCIEKDTIEKLLKTYFPKATE